MFIASIDLPGFIPHGPMDKASAYGAEDSRFDPWCGSPLLCFFSFGFFVLARALQNSAHSRTLLEQAFLFWLVHHTTSSCFSRQMAGQMGETLLEQGLAADCCSFAGSL